ncbi:hypothetical protein GW943_02395 [Candidatus Parcubacteria bacterium]|uniref:Ig-like domain-containing protein n=1 Tax=Candidatus Kaiserbacteria bacterium CG10_big_fil_rev_8_21_14_0_10_47_16 TaxID=1974608 RepID=A0A2H0UDS9_9BACT|nr:hypothetical protein [Candidatus Parcubacteria bacterium]PIR84510.1 MAG: hypothetical protein COU16_02955 [Candidatus Kaiserbacteria bacterium CG10_big_fil_rev_8_21_14_0_10_47_16]
MTMNQILTKKRLLLSAALLVAIAALVISATGAFFNDTETSTGNIFTAGSIDLKVDHLKQTYNGEDCTTRCNRWAEEVTSFNQGLRKGGDAVLAGRSNPDDATGPADTSGSTPDVSPTGFVSLGFGGSIVLHFPDGIDDGPGDDLRIYEATGVTSPAYPDESVKVEVSPNGSDWTTVDVSPSSVTFDGTIEIDLDGNAPLVYYVRITDTTDPTLHNSDADGFDLDAVRALHCDNEDIDGIPSDVWQCQLWEETDLTDQTFFTFNDVKPGDLGTNVISLHVFDNDAYTCLIAHDGEDAENDIMEPEAKYGDDDQDGELQDYITFFSWLDTDADGVYETGETSLGESTLGNLGSIASLDSDNGQYLTATTTGYVGLAWCAGTISANIDNAFGCDGSTMHNDAMSDSFTASLTAYAEQVRNNGSFQCENIHIGDDQNGGGNENEVAEDDLETGDKVAAKVSGAWFFYNDTNDTVMSIDQFSGSGGENHFEAVAGSGAAKMVLHEAAARYNIATYRYNDVKLSDIGTLSYRMYDGSVSGETPYLHFNVDFDNSDTWQRRLVQVPTGVTANTWTTVDALAGMWTLSGGNWPAGAVDNTGTTPGSTPRTWADILANYPNAETRSTDSWFGIRVGHPGPAGETGYVDWINFDGQISDFE